MSRLELPQASNNGVAHSLEMADLKTTKDSEESGKKEDENGHINKQEEDDEEEEEGVVWKVINILSIPWKFAFKYTIPDTENGWVVGEYLLNISPSNL